MSWVASWGLSGHDAQERVVAPTWSAARDEILGQVEDWVLEHAEEEFAEDDAEQVAEHVCEWDENKPAMLHFRGLVYRLERVA